ncbi:MAG: hypothetical protein QGI47_02445, partial [Candidatus Marinimicrobia bacterium]|nr:hypothetical protein [Candidatus Neomarinimicrobiota bacterium]
MKKYLIITLLAVLPSSIFAIAGLGLSVNQSLFSVGSSSSPLLVEVPGLDPMEVGSFTHHGFENAAGIGGYLYLDIIPVIDLDVEFNVVGNLYNFSFINPVSNLDSVQFAYAAANTYITIQKSVFDLGIPFLARANLYAGLGYNQHVGTPMINQEMLTTVVGGNIETGEIDEDALIDYLKENKLEATGFHVQAGLQMHLLTFDVFAYYRYTMAKDVVPG